jgi:hypothetical protein
MKRDLTLDSLRGILLIVMTIDHLAIALHQYTIHALGFITAAEGFIFLSGFVAGTVYSRIQTQSVQRLWASALQRVGTIYLFHMIVFSLIMLLGLTSTPLMLAWRETMPYFINPLLLQHPLQALGLGSILLYQPAFLDILPLYCVFLLITPLLLSAFQKGLARQVFTGSLLLWGAAQFGLLAVGNQILKNFFPINLGAFDILAWQVLFISGLYWGFRRYHRTQEQRHFQSRPGYLAVAVTTVVVLFMLRQQGFGQSIASSLNGWWLFEPLTGKEHLGLIRVLNFAALSYVIASVYGSFGRLITWRWFSTLGQHSLQVYAFHVLLLFLAAPFLTPLRSLPTPLCVLSTCAILMSLFIPVWLHQRYQEAVKNFQEASPSTGLLVLSLNR